MILTENYEQKKKNGCVFLIDFPFKVQHCRIFWGLFCLFIKRPARDCKCVVSFICSYNQETVFSPQLAKAPSLLLFSTDLVCPT